MASDFPETKTMQFALGGSEVEDFEVTEVDGAILWDLLEELENEEKKSDKSDLIGLDSDNTMTAVTLPFERSEIGGIPDSTSNWVEMDDMMMQTDPLQEIEGWFRDDMVGMVDFGYSVGDYSQLHSGVEAFSTEIPYTDLWEEI